MLNDPNSSEAAAPDPGTGLPLLRTWQTVYAVVAGIFVFWIVLLTIFPWFFA